MPKTYRELISQIRLNLLEPHPAKPSDLLILTKLGENARLLFNQALNTPVPWSLESFILDVDENNDLYLLQAPNFSKDVLVETIDPTDPNHVSRPVRRMSMQSSALGGNAPYVTYYGDFSQTLLGDKHWVQTFVFYRDSAGNVNIKVLPKPQVGAQAAQYKIWYETADPNTDALGNFWPIPAGQDLLCLRTAFSCLPGAEWPGMTKEECAAKRQELGLTLDADAKAHNEEYRRYLATDRQVGLTVVRGFQDDEYSWG